MFRECYHLLEVSLVSNLSVIWRTYSQSRQKWLIERGWLGVLKFDAWNTLKQMVCVPLIIDAQTRISYLKGGNNRLFYAAAWWSLVWIKKLSCFNCLCLFCLWKATCLCKQLCSLEATGCLLLSLLLTVAHAPRYLYSRGHAGRRGDMSPHQPLGQGHVNKVMCIHLQLAGQAPGQKPPVGVLQGPSV